MESAREAELSATSGSRMLPAAEPRAETGPVQFGNDWPGVFFRGDTAFYYAFHLEQILKGGDNPVSRMILKGLLDTLKASNIHANIKQNAKSRGETPLNTETKEKP